MDRKSTERVYAWGKDTEGMEDGPDSADMEEQRGVHDPGKCRGTTTQPSTETVVEGLWRKDHEKGRM